MHTTSFTQPRVQDRLANEGARALSDEDLVAVLLGSSASDDKARRMALDLLSGMPLAEAAWASPDVLAQQAGVSAKRAARLAAAFELGRRAAWQAPRRGDQCLDPRSVYEIMRPLAHAEREEFHAVLLDVRGRLIKAAKIAEGSLTQCPVSPRDALREAVRAGAHGVVFAHNHPSGDATPSLSDSELTERLRAACEMVGVVARDHLIVAATGYYSFVEAGRWHR